MNNNQDEHKCVYRGNGHCKTRGCHERKIRYFTCRLDGEDIGRFVGQNPKIAASKVFSMLHKSGRLDPEYNDIIKVGERGDIVFEIRECSQWKRKKKSYYYTGYRVVYDEPTEIKIRHRHDGEYTYRVVRFNGINRIGRLKKDQVPEEFFFVNGYN